MVNYEQYHVMCLGFQSAVSQNWLFQPTVSPLPHVMNGMYVTFSSLCLFPFHLYYTSPLYIFSLFIFLLRLSHPSPLAGSDLVS